MELTLLPVRTVRDFKDFLHFPWLVNRGDSNWVPPILKERLERLDPEKNVFWQGVERDLWIARRGKQAVGTIAAFLPLGNQPGGEGRFGFFDCLNDPQATRALFDAAEDWLRARGAGWLRGPFNPGENDDPGVLIDGFDTRPAIMEGHNPSYYPLLYEQSGYSLDSELVARLLQISPKWKSVDDGLPERLLKVAVKAEKRTDLRIRAMDPRRWEEDIHLGWEIFNASLANVPGAVQRDWEEFKQAAQGFRPFLWPDMGLIAEIGGRPAGFALALPDINEAIRPLNGRLGTLNLLRLWWGLKRIRRVSFKILMVLPEFQGRGVEAVLIREVGRAIMARGFREVDMSLTGVLNEKSNRFQEHLGFKIYRRYHIYTKRLDV